MIDHSRLRGVLIYDVAVILYSTMPTYTFPTTFGGDYSTSLNDVCEDAYGLPHPFTSSLDTI